MNIDISMKCKNCGKDIDLCAEEYCGMPQRKMKQTEYIRLIQIQENTKGEPPRIPECIFDELCLKLPEDFRKNHLPSNLEVIEFVGIINYEKIPLRSFLSKYLDKYTKKQLTDLYYEEINDKVPEIEEYGAWQWGKEYRAILTEEEE